MRASPFVFTVVFLSMVLPPLSARAGWVQNGTVICDADMDQDFVVAVPDGSGGAYLAWRDYRNYTDFDIYAQRIDSYGDPVWAPNGVPVCLAAYDQSDLAIAADGFGGVLITWLDYRNGTDVNLYAQHLDDTGDPVWTTNGVAACTAADVQDLPQITADGTGGAYVVWEDYRNGLNLDVYYQHILDDGALHHGSTGAVVCTTSYNQGHPVLAPDGAGGIIVVWHDARSGTNYDIYGARFGPAGNTFWPSNGQVLCNAPDSQLFPWTASDGLGGVYIVWVDDRGTDRDVYAQRVSRFGYALWAGNGIPLCTASGTQEDVVITVDQSDGGLLVAWWDQRVGGNPDIFAQKVDLFGDTAWTTDGVAVCSATGYQEQPAIAPDGEGGAIVCWTDSRYLVEPDLFAQRVGADGLPVWANNGECVASYVDFQQASAVVSDGECGAIVMWQDYRNSENYDVYGQRITDDGVWGYPCPFIYSVRDVPGDQGGLINVAWDASRLDVPPGDIDTYSVWRAIDAMAAAARLKAGAMLVDGPALAGGRFTEGVLRADNPYYWELVETVQAYQLDRYAKPVATLFDSTSVTGEFHHFQVIAHDTGGGMWISPPASGRSIDNLAPAAPLSLAAGRVLQEVALEWSPSDEFTGDLSHYAVYRSETAGFTPGPANFLATAPDTMLTDTSAELFKRYYYRVTAWDIHENQSAPSNEAMVDVATGVEDRTPSYDRLTLLPNTPNPFGGTTEIRFGLPAESDVVFEVYDIAGRRVLERRLERMPAGLRTWTFDGRDRTGARLASGVYFYRVTAVGVTETRKLVITR